MVDRARCRTLIAGESLHAHRRLAARIDRDVARRSIDEAMNGLPKRLKIAARDVARVDDDRQRVLGRTYLDDVAGHMIVLHDEIVGLQPQQWVPGPIGSSDQGKSTL